MPEIVDGRKVFTLVEVAASIQKTLAQRYASSFWVKAEMNKLNYYPHSGHCYPDLVEKVDGGRVIAQLKSTLWRDDYVRINENFLSVVKSPLTEGIKILFCARITFDPVHGLALRITDIDPVFSLGELEREKQETISKLKEEGIFDRNKTLPFPLLPQRLAVISVQTSKGYADFNKVINNNPWDYKLFHVLFPSLLQGDRAVESIRSQLERIRSLITHFDVVAIIRGGGGDVGLSCFNNLMLCRDIAQFPIPVLTGIGHATNETVAEMVSYKNAITPTELADYLLHRFREYAEPVHQAEEIIVEKARQILANERKSFHHTVRIFRSVASNVLVRSRHEVREQEKNLFRQSAIKLLHARQTHDSLAARLKTYTNVLCKHHGQQVTQLVSTIGRATEAFIKRERTQAENIEKVISVVHPVNVLKRGYSITRANGKALISASDVKEGDELETVLANGSILSAVHSTKQSSDL
jgi:exodeoxyribonuclease VII large subunit